MKRYSVERNRAKLADLRILCRLVIRQWSHGRRPFFLGFTIGKGPQR